MTTITIPAATLEHSARAALAHADSVGAALRMYLESRTPEGAQFAASKLRAALVTLSEGFEPGAGNGSTFGERRAQAQLALRAWTEQA